MPELINHQRSQEWLDARKGKVTASLAAGCLGLDPYCSARRAWRQIMGIGRKEEDGDTYGHRARQWGVQFEAAARLDYEVQTGNLVTQTGFWTHPLLDWLGASPDGLIGTGGLCEIKVPTVPPTRVPLQHRIQCLIQIACTERLWCDYFAWGASGQFFLARVYRAGIPGLIIRLEAFYRAYVLTGIEPPKKRRKTHAH